MGPNRGPSRRSRLTAQGFSISAHGQASAAIRLPGSARGRLRDRAPTSSSPSVSPSLAARFEDRGSRHPCLRSSRKRGWSRCRPCTAPQRWWCEARAGREVAPPWRRQPKAQDDRGEACTRQTGRLSGPGCCGSQQALRRHGTVSRSPSDPARRPSPVAADLAPAPRAVGTITPLAARLTAPLTAIRDRMKRAAGMMETSLIHHLRGPDPPCALRKSSWPAAPCRKTDGAPATRQPPPSCLSAAPVTPTTASPRGSGDRRR